MDLFGVQNIVMDSEGEDVPSHQACCFSAWVTFSHSCSMSLS